MGEYRAPIEEIRFALRHHAGLPDLLRYAAYSGADPELIDGLLEEAARFMSEVISPLNVVGDREGARLVDGRVILPSGFSEAYRKLIDAGWTAVSAPEEHGGGGLPFVIYSVIFEMMAASNLSFVLCPSLGQGVIHALDAHASDELKRLYLPRLVSGEWAGTMDLTEPEAGSDLGAMRTLAEPQPDGSYHLKGGKIFITFGDHELTDNIIHLVLARTPDAPSGSRGISLFIVPKRLVDSEGRVGADNGIRVVSLEHKLGIHASPTCVLSYGEDTPTVGYRIGEENRGLQYMFTMMNRERIDVGNQGLSIGQRAYQQACEYAHEREQGRAPEAELPPGTRSTIIDHPDVRRMLLTMRAQLDAMRGLLYEASALNDRAIHHPDPEARAAADARLALVTPIVKAWLTDLGVEITSQAIQVHGGVGYIEETGVAQYYRDARIPPIYEGTNGVQAMDLVTRKLPMQGGEVLRGILKEMREIAARVEAAGDEISSLARPLAAGIDALDEASEWLLLRSGSEARSIASGASPYLRLFGSVMGAIVLTRAALAVGDEDAGQWSPGFLEERIAIARFYVEQLLPPAVALVPAITAGADPLFAISRDRY